MKLKLFLFLLFFGILAVVFIFTPKFYPINKIVCTSQYGPCPANIEKALSDLVPGKYYQIKKEVGKILGNEFDIKEYSLSFKLPDKIELSILQKKAKFALKDSGQKIHIFTEEFDYISEEKTTHLPMLVVQNTISEKYKLNDEEKFALNLLYKLYENDKIKILYLMSDRLETYIDNNIKLIFPLTGDLNYLLGSLTIVKE